MVYSVGIMGELLKYGGSGMVDLLEQLFSVINNYYGRRRLSPGNGERALLLIFRIERILVITGVSPYSVLYIGKVFCKILNRLVQCLDKEGALHEGQTGFRLNRGCMDNVYTLNEIVQGRLRENKKTCILFRYTESLRYCLA